MVENTQARSFDPRRFVEGPPEYDQRVAARHESARARDVELRRQSAYALCFGQRPRYQACTFDNFETPTGPHRDVLAAVRRFAEAIDRNISEGAGALLYGPPGGGKDHLLAALVRAAINVGRSVRWYSGMDLFGEVRDRIGDGLDERSFIAKLIGPDVLAISDPLPPFGDLTTFQATCLLRVVDGRYSRRRPTWLTVNVADRTEAERRMGTQVVDRLSDGALVLHCNWPSYRRPRRDDADWFERANRHDSHPTQS